ncbi:MAG: MBL fold metallo-hydrolase [Prevotellaceae bacterium]|nr:MBL fold metallo-hydrolase [Prevotellaceae bacterium]
MQVKCFQVNPFMENTYVVYDRTRQAVIIDCGCLYREEEQALEDFVRDEHLEIRHVINTHLHLDHQFGNHFASQTFGVLPEAHREDESMIAGLPSQAMLFGIAERVTAQPLGAYLAENDIITFGQSSLKAIHVPGHSRGSLCFYAADAGMIFVGDVLFAGSIGRTDLPGGNHAQLISGIQSKLLVLPDATIVYAGHGTDTTIKRERDCNPFLQM